MEEKSFNAFEHFTGKDAVINMSEVTTQILNKQGTVICRMITDKKHTKNKVHRQMAKISKKRNRK